MDIISILLFIGVVIGINLWHVSRSHDILRQWADENGYEIMERSYRNLLKGPFFLSGEGQTVYWVQVRDKKGRVHKGWVRCGGWFSGLWSNQVQVQWEE